MKKPQNTNFEYHASKTDPRDIETRVDEIVHDALTRTCRMFDWKVPDSINSGKMEYLLQTGSPAVYALAPHNGKLYFLLGNVGGYYTNEGEPTIFTFASPYLQWEGTLKVGKDCVLIRNNTVCRPLTNTLEHYATMMATAELSLYIAAVNSRMTNVVSAGNDGDKDAFDLFVQDVESGQMGAVMGKNILNGLKSIPYGGETQAITDLVELLQYEKASMANYYGVDLNYNMKRESIVSAESEMNADGLLTLPYDMLLCRKEAVEQAKELFPEEAAELSVDFSEIWKKKTKEGENNEADNGVSGMDDERTVSDDSN